MQAIVKLKNGKSAGLDGVKYEMLKCGQSSLTPCIVKLFNHILSSGQYPKEWKKSYIKPLYKGDDPLDPSNYRGISIMSCMSKLFSSVLNNRLQTFFDKNKIINETQIGFQPKARTSDHMFVLRTLIEKYQSLDSKLYVCFVDFQKAFDSVVHNILFYKLCKVNISGLFYNVLKNMYSENCIQIKVGNNLSEQVSQNVGVRQGDNLSPNLFKLFLNDLPACFDEEDDQVSLDSISFSCLLYADDLLLLSTTEAGLQRCLNKLSLYCCDNGLTVNLKKTQIITFSKSGRKSNCNILFNNVEIEEVQSYKYLGVLFSASGTFSHCQNDLYKRALKAQFKLSKCFGDLHQNVDTILHLFDHTVKPVLLYGSEIWGTINTLSANVKKDGFSIFDAFCNMPCEKLHIKFLKYVLGVHRKTTNVAVMGELGRYPIIINVICDTVKYFERLISDDVSNLLKGALKENGYLHEHKKKNWLSSLYFLFEYLNISKSSISNDKLASVAKSKLIKRYKAEWMNALSKNRDNQTGKLRTYSLFKYRLCRESYFKYIKDISVRRIFTKLRVSCHKLEIELGRYKKVQADARLCPLCQLEVEDEIHFVTNCSLFSTKRKQFFNDIGKSFVNFSGMSDVQKFIWLFSNENAHVIRELSVFVYDCYMQRFEMLRK